MNSIITFIFFFTQIHWSFSNISSKLSNKNIVLIIADDLDTVLDGMFVASPICCPNRASILTGRYQHNHITVNNSLSGGCSNRKWQRKFESRTFAKILKDERGYDTFYAGKYMNQYGMPRAGGVNHVPAGWDWWAGLVGNSKYYDYSLSINGTERKYGHKNDDYLTDVINKMAIDFINGSVNRNSPFLMVLAPPAPHEPFTPAARHIDKYKSVIAKRTPNFNTPHQPNKHWLVQAGNSPLSQNTISQLNFIYRRRWEALLAVDELVTDVYNALQSKNILNDTYIIFTSDNGYHIGQFSMPKDKRQPYETDIKVPLMIRGPGITPSSVINPSVSSVDLFSTILQMAGIKENSTIMSDGTSLLTDNIHNNRTVLIEYKGEHSTKNTLLHCPSDYDINVSHCDQQLECKCEDAVNNTYSCIRRVSEDNNDVFCVFKDNQNYMEAYNLNRDPYQLYNIGYTMKLKQQKNYQRRLNKMAKCHGNSCIYY